MKEETERKEERRAPSDSAADTRDQVLQDSGNEREEDANGTGRKSRHSAGRIIGDLIAIAALVVLVVSVALAIPQLKAYREGEKGYSDLIDETIHVADGAEDTREESTGTASAAEAAAEDTAAAEEESEEDGAGATDPKKNGNRRPGYYPEVEIDYDALEKVNSDFVGVIYLPVLDILYPVAHSHDNNEYLRRTFYGQRNSAGCIFMDEFSAGDYSDLNTFILGHNMRNYTMFGSLKKFEADKDLCDQDPFFYIYNRDTIRKYRIFSYYEVGVNEKLYDADRDYNDPDVYDSFVEEAQDRSHYETKDTFDFSERPAVVTLSTCWLTDHVDNLVVHGVLVEEFHPEQTAGAGKRP